jgi:thioredoxin reductase (NADPH)
MMKDLIIIGGGPAGLTAGLYSSRARVDTLVIEKGMPGGQVMTTEWVENYPGFEDGLSGPDLSLKMKLQAEKFGLKISHGTVSEVITDGDIKKLIMEDGLSYEAKALIIATGASLRHLGVEGEEKFRGRGVSYCATCDGAFFRDKKLVVAGGGNTAVEEAVFLTRFVSELHVVHRRDKLRADKIIQERAFQNPKIKLEWNSVIDRINGSDTVESVTLKDVNTNEKRELETDGVFIFIGYDPNVDAFKDIVELDENNNIIVDRTMATSVPGIYAAGDVTNSPLNQIVTAVGEGALAAVSAEKYIEEHFS